MVCFIAASCFALAVRVPVDRASNVVDMFSFADGGGFGVLTGVFEAGNVG